MEVIGWDIGGANIKAAHCRGPSIRLPFQLWQRPRDLADALESAARQLPPTTHWLVSMTGELCDCFETKRHGVSSILQDVRQAAGETKVGVWQTNGKIVSIAEASSDYLATAAANWHALATFVARHLCGDSTGLLIDVGSTTTDIVLLADERPVADGRTDTDRLLSGELTYCGVGRTPIMALVDCLPWKDQICPIASELFATTNDVFLTLREIDDDPNDRVTADGRPATRRWAVARMSRMICGDSEQCSDDDIVEMAHWVRQKIVERLLESLKRVLRSASAPPKLIVCSGSGEWLAKRLAQQALPEGQVVLFSEQFGRVASQAACAWALAHLGA